MKNILIILILGFLAFYGYQKFQTKQSVADFDIAPTYSTANDSIPDLKMNGASLNSQNYRCDGRTHCSQMTSCAEATYFSNNCPNTKMDGNRDGVPCEKQWCR